MKKNLQQHKDKYAKYDDNMLIEKIKNGEQHLFQYIIMRYEKKIFLYVMQFTRNVDESHDIVQNVFMKSMRHINQFDINRKFSSWIYRIAYNETMTWFSKRKKQKTVPIDELEVKKEYNDAVSMSETALEKWFHVELRGELNRALGQLPEKYAYVLHLKYFDDKSYKEIAHILNKPVNTVGTLVRRAKKKLLVIVLEHDINV